MKYYNISVNGVAYSVSVEETAVRKRTSNDVRRTGRTGRRIQGMKENVGVVNPAGDVKRRKVL